jgi:hypothetical protein
MNPLEEGAGDNTASCPILYKFWTSIAHDPVVNGNIPYAMTFTGCPNNITDELATLSVISGFQIGDIMPQMRGFGNKRPYWSPDSTSELLIFKPTRPHQLFPPGIEWPTRAPTTANAVSVKSQVDTETEKALAVFGKGLEDWVVKMAKRIAKAALDKTVEPEITVDVDGALSFDLRLTDGSLVLAELEPNGALDASVYDRQGDLVKRLRQATESGLVDLF